MRSKERWVGAFLSEYVGNSVGNVILNGGSGQDLDFHGST